MCLVLKKALADQGEDDVGSIEALETYVAKCCKTGAYLLDISDYDDASRVLDECLHVLKTEIHSSYPRLLYQVYYRQA